MDKTTGPQTRHIRLRQAQAEDLPVLLTILHAAFAEYSGQLDPPSGVHHETVESLQERMQQGGAVLALINEEAVGCVFFEIEPTHLYLGRLSVLPEHRSQGVARALIADIEQQARTLGLPRVQLGVRLALPRLVAYYTQLGYQPVRYGMHEGYSEPTFVIMEKDLTQNSGSDQ